MRKLVRISASILICAGYASAGAAQTTALFIKNGAQQSTWTTSNATFISSIATDTVNSTVGARRVSVDVSPRSGGRRHLLFGLPAGNILAAGTYEYAFPADWSTLPEFDYHDYTLGTDGGECEPLGTNGGPISSGRFVIYELAIDNGALVRFAADFEVKCGPPTVGPGVGFVTGSIRYNSTRTTLAPFGGAYPLYALQLAPTTGGYVTAAGLACGDGGRTACRRTYGATSDVTLLATPSAGYEFVAWGGSCGGGERSITLHVDYLARCFAVFHPTAASGAAPDPTLAAQTVLVDSTLYPFRTISLAADGSAPPTYSSGAGGSLVSMGGVSLGVSASSIAPGDYAVPAAGASLSAPRCYTVTAGHFTVYQADYDGSGALTAFDADFEATCQSGSSMTSVAGALRYNASRATLRYFDEPFLLTPYRLQVATFGGSVTGSGIDCGAGTTGNCEDWQDAAFTSTLQATPAPGYAFSRWTDALGGPCIGTATSITIVVDQARSCRAVFVPTASNGDLNDDGLADLLWERDDGLLAAWMMNGTTLVSSPFLSPPQVSRPSWRIAGTGDFDGDGRADIVWQDVDAGWVAVWLMNGITLRSSQLLYPVPIDTDWQIRGVQDMDGDGRPDIVWQHLTRGTIAIWHMDGLTFRDSVLLSESISDLDWRLAMVRDLTKDGVPDLLWQHPDGQLVIWQMDGLETKSEDAFSVPVLSDPAWRIAAAGDFNGDGQVDLVLQHSTDRRLEVWFLDGDVVTGTSPLTPSQVSSTAWKIQGPH